MAECKVEKKNESEALKSTLKVGMARWSANDKWITTILLHRARIHKKRREQCWIPSVKGSGWKLKPVWQRRRRN
jgi:hypothetical protein